MSFVNDYPARSSDLYPPPLAPYLHFHNSIPNVDHSIHSVMVLYIILCYV